MSETEIEKKRRLKRESQARYRAKLKRRAQKAGAPARELKPHGTVAAYKRHERERKKARDAGLEPPPICDACRKAWAEKWNEYAKASGEKTYRYGRGGPRSRPVVFVLADYPSRTS